MARKREVHYHQYQLKNYGSKGKKVYACVRQNCSHFQIEKTLLIGKIALCNQCQSPFELTADIIARDVVRPRCRDCREIKPLGGPRRDRQKPTEEKSLDDALNSLRERLNLF